ncbi:MAG: hypothetical protein O4861_06845 [Trichodesmium sp. St16_bin4-tuft]|nr:hypothetical protein [Trichodesmium sp. MAG_R01]MDE5098063.1 hypothetical protein [Trichodesmium sp. St16_bin4-tuft]
MSAPTIFVKESYDNYICHEAEIVRLYNILISWSRWKQVLSRLKRSPLRITLVLLPLDIPNDHKFFLSYSQFLLLMAC